MCRGYFPEVIAFNFKRVGDVGIFSRMILNQFQVTSLYPVFLALGSVFLIVFINGSETVSREIVSSCDR